MSDQNNNVYYVCKYTPVELLECLGRPSAQIFNHMPEGFDLADQIAHPNICGFGKALLEASSWNGRYQGTGPGKLL